MSSTNEEPYSMKDDTVESKVTAKSFEELYQVEEELGQGVFSTVHLAHHKSTGDEYAVKIIQKPEMEEFDKQCLLREIDVLSELQHPNIIRLYDVFDAPTSPKVHLVMEYVPGGMLLERLIDKEQYTEKEARDVCQILMQAMQHCHHHSIAHRDLKPENLLLMSPDDDTSLKICDFGFAKRAPTDTSLKTQCGSAQHVAPEILHNVPYGTKVDMWALGVIAFTLIGGYPPFYAETNQETFQRILKVDLQFEEEYWSHISEDCKNMIKGLLTKDPTQRWSAGETLDCPWMKEHEDDELSRISLHSNQQVLAAFNAKQKLKAAVYTIIGIDRLQFNGALPVLVETVNDEEDSTTIDAADDSTMPTMAEDEEEPTDESPPVPKESEEEPTIEAADTTTEATPAEEATEEPATTTTEDPPHAEEEPEPEPPTEVAPPAIEDAVPPNMRASVATLEAQAAPVATPTTTTSAITTRDLYAAFNIHECKGEPVAKDYFALAQKTGDFFETILKQVYNDGFESVDVTLRKSLYNSGQPSDQYNIYIEWDVTVQFSTSTNIPTRRELCGKLVQANLEPYLLDYVRPLEGTAWEMVTMCFFGHFAC